MISEVVFLLAPHFTGEEKQHGKRFVQLNTEFVTKPGPDLDLVTLDKAHFP